MKNRWGNRLAAAIEALLCAVFPQRCIMCRELMPKGDLCEECQAKISPQERLINIPMGKKSRMLKVYSPHVYTAGYRETIGKFKFEGATHHAVLLARFIYAHTPPEAFADADIITFVPMTRRCIRERGYNQAELLAKELSKLCAIPCSQLLNKTAENKAQHTLSSKNRKDNVKNVFALNGDINGHKIIIIDDIITTGSTMCECGRVLFKGGAAAVTGICAASV